MLSHWPLSFDMNNLAALAGGKKIINFMLFIFDSIKLKNFLFVFIFINIIAFHFRNDI